MLTDLLTWNTWKTPIEEIVYTSKIVDLDYIFTTMEFMVKKSYYLLIKINQQQTRKHEFGDKVFLARGILKHQWVNNEFELPRIQIMRESSITK